MAATLAETLQAVTDLLTPLVTAGTLKRAINGPQDQLNEFPAAWVWFGPATVSRQAYERQITYTGFVRVYADRRGLLPGDYARLVPPVDAILAACRDNPTLGDLAERFDATAVSLPAYDAELNALSVDVQWAALVIEPDTYEQDWR